MILLCFHILSVKTSILKNIMQVFHFQRCYAPMLHYEKQLITLLNSTILTEFLDKKTIYNIIIVHVAEQSENCKLILSDSKKL